MARKIIDVYCMIINYWAGIITSDIILQHKHSGTWANEWFEKALLAEISDMRLVVFQVPEKNYTEIVSGIEYDLQHDYGLLPMGLLMPEE